MDEAGALRLIVPIYTFPDLLRLALEEIEHYSAHDVQIPRRLSIMLANLIAVALPCYQPLLRQRLRDLPNGPNLTPTEDAA